MAKATQTLEFWKNAGAQATHLQNTDWNASPLGDPSQWPAELKVSLGIILNNRLPKILCWGRNLTCVYNKVYLNEIIRNQHQEDILGKPLDTALPMVWEKLKDRIQDYFEKHHNVQIEIKADLLLPDGRREPISYICNQLQDASGLTTGILLTVRSSQNNKLRSPEPGNQLFQEMMQAAPVGMLSLTGSDFKIVMANATFLQLTGNTESMVVGKPLFEIYPLIRPKFEPILTHVLESGESFYGDELAVPISFGKKEKKIYLNVVLQPLKGQNGQASTLMAVIVDVTSIVEERRSLTEKEDIFKKMIKESSIRTLILKGSDYVIEYGNDSLFSDFFQISQSDAINRKLTDLFPELAGQQVMAEMEFVFRSGATVQKKEASIFLRGPEGNKQFFFDYEMMALKGDQDIVTGIMISMHDVTETVLIKMREKENQQRLEMSLDAGGLALWEMDLPPERMSYTARLTEILGVSDIGYTSVEEFRSFIHPDYRKEIEQVFERAMETGEYFFEGKFTRSDNTTGWLRIRGKVFYDEAHKPIKLIGSTRDITDEKKKQHALQRKEYRLRHLIMEAPVAIGILRGPDFRVEIINDVAVSLLGKTRKQLEGQPILQVMAEVDKSIAKGLLDQVYYQDRTISGTEYPVKLLRNGKMEKIYVHFEYDPLKNSEGKTIGIMVVGFDVTHQVVSRKTIEESERRFKLLANAAPNFVWSMNEHGEVKFINQTFQWYSGYSLNDIGLLFRAPILHPDDAEKAFDRWKRSLQTGTEFIDEHRIRRHDGGYRWYLTRAIPERENTGKPVGWIATSTDIQEIKEQEIQKDYFISRASHELKTPMTSLKGYIQILQSVNQQSEDTMLLHSLSRMNLQVDKLTRLIDDLLDTTRISKEGLTVTKEYFNLCDLIYGVIEDVSSFSDYEIEFDDTNCDVLVYGDKEKLAQVVTNLLTNAIKYSPGTQHVWIRSTKAGNILTVHVIDHGIGIDKAAQEKIFEKFYRVSGKNEDTFPGFGIGLFIANEILKMHNSRLHVESELGKGSQFYFTIEIHPAEPRNAEAV